jgi:hypothetical protein
MGNKNLTAVDWLIETLESDIEVDESNMVTIKMHEHDYLTSKVIAKEMEKEQIIESYRDGRSDQQSERQSRFYNRKAEQYYNETYG